MDDKFGMQITLNPPKIDSDLNTITYKTIVESAENLDDAIFAEICKIAKESGATTLVVLDKTQIRMALEKQVAKKIGSNNNRINRCPTCNKLLSRPQLHCHGCGQKLEWRASNDG